MLADSQSQDSSVSRVRDIGMVVKESGSALALAVGLERGGLQQRLALLKCGVLAD